MTTFQNNSFKKQWSKVETALKDFKNNNVLPLTVSTGNGEKVITFDSLQEQIENYKQQKFTIAVCGQVKAGKSTLLNSLFFGDDILPIFDTPMTAKLTFIEYKEGKPGFKAEFYSKDEWEEVKKVMKENGDKQLDARLQVCAEKYGVREGNTIGIAPKHVDDLKQLDQYVSVPMPGKKTGNDCCGKYTPFVKQVFIHLPAENLKDVRIVDTPGLNDSNTINSQETEKWVKNAHAVVYVLQVTGCHDYDVEFFQRYFPGSAAEARLFVQNQIDTHPEDWQSVVNQLHENGKKKEYEELGLFGPKETICSYSALIALANAKKAKNKQLTGEQQFAIENFEGDDFNPDPNELAETLEKKLYASEAGKIRIVRAMGEFITLLRQKQQEVSNQIQNKKNEIKACSLDDEKLSGKIKNLNEFCRKVDDKNKRVKFECDQEFERVVMSPIHNELNEAINDLTRKLHMKIDGMSTINEIKNRLPGVFCNEAHIKFEELRDKFVSAPGRIFELLDRKKEEIRELASALLILDDFPSQDYLGDFASKELAEKLDKFYNIEKILTSKISWTSFFLSMENVKNKAKNIVNDTLQGFRHDVEAICSDLKDASTKQVFEFSSNMMQWAKGHKDSLEIIKNNKQDMEQKKKDLENTLSELEKEKPKWEKMEKDYQQRANELEIYEAE